MPDTDRTLDGIRAVMAAHPAAPLGRLIADAVGDARTLSLLSDAALVARLCARHGVPWPPPPPVGPRATTGGTSGSVVAVVGYRQIFLQDETVRPFRVFEVDVDALPRATLERCAPGAVYSWPVRADGQAHPADLRIVLTAEEIAARRADADAREAAIAAAARR